jgi:tyrosinase
MHSIATTFLFAICGQALAAARSVPPVAPVLDTKAPCLPLSAYDTAKFARPLTLMEAVTGANASVTTMTGNLTKIKEQMPELQIPNVHLPSTHRAVQAELERFEKRQSTCSNPRVRVEWDSLSTSDRQSFVDSMKCLMRARPSGRFNGAQNRYEDIVVLHQQMTPRVHGNAIFLLWHRYLLWTFEDLLRRECGFTRPLPWFDESKWSGRFQQSSVFSSQWMGTMLTGGNCVNNGQFAFLASNIGPGPSNQRHCLSRNGDESKTSNTRQSITDACNSRGSYADMAACSEGGAHAWGHNGIGAIMQDVYASPADPVFWLHHAYVDRNLWTWQNRDGRRTSSVNGEDGNGRGLTPDTILTMNGLRMDARIRDVLNTQSQLLCYRYSS